MAGNAASATVGTINIRKLTASPDLSALITSKSGTQTAREWTITVSNSGLVDAVTSRIDKVTLTQAYGTACTAVITSPAAFPLSMGPIPAGSSASGTLTIDFTGCASTTRFVMVIWYSADIGWLSESKALFTNQSQ
jgi:hypothetical protein